MNRRARAVPLRRMNLEKLVLELILQDQSDWPKPRRMAYEVLRYRLSCSEEVALQLLIDALRAAHACASRIDQRSVTVAQVGALTKMREACARIAKCAKRAPASLRRDLDRAVVELARRPPIDMETIEAFFDAVNEAFDKHPGVEAAKTANSALAKLDWKLEFEKSCRVGLALESKPSYQSSSRPRMAP